MKRKCKILGLSIGIAAILALVIAGTVAAASDNQGTDAGTQNRGDKCLCGQCPCGDCVCGDCEPINHAYNHAYAYSSMGPHGQQNGECSCGECVCGDCEPINHAYNHDYSYSSMGPHRQQRGK